jgi:hypothetical protein
MSTRQALPGEHLSPSCGHHCGIRSTADEGTLSFIGHCPCPECGCIYADSPWADPGYTGIKDDIAAIARPPRTPMCDRWYERSGGVRPWDSAGC